MHPDRTRSQHKTSAEPWSWSQNATDVDSKRDFDKHWEFNHKQSHLLNKWDQKYLNGFIGKWATQSDNEKILMLWLLDGNRRVRGEKRRGFFLPLAPLSPWRQEWLPTWNQKPKVNLSYTNQLYSTKPFTSQCCCKHHISPLPLIKSTCNYIRSSEAALLNNTALWFQTQTEASSKSVKPIMQKLYHIFCSNIRHELQAFTADETFAIYVLQCTKHTICNLLPQGVSQSKHNKRGGRPGRVGGVSDQLLRAASS